MPAYRMKHVPSGLYYCPSRDARVNFINHEGSAYVKTNLSKRGKVYLSRPSFKWIGGTFYTHLGQFRYTWSRDTIRVPFVVADWIIEPVE